MQDEMQSLEKNCTWEVVPLPKGKKPVRCKWIFKRKEGLSPSESPKFKRRLVAKGYSQIPGVDYNDVFSPVVKHSSIRTFLHIHYDNNLEKDPMLLLLVLPCTRRKTSTGGTRCTCCAFMQFVYLFFSRTCLSTCFIKSKKSITNDTVVSGLMTRPKGRNKKLQYTRHVPVLTTSSYRTQRQQGVKASANP
jgi:hypothetical protein